MSSLKNAMIKAGKALYGDRWQTDLSRDLDLPDGRRMRQWMSGDRPIPSDTLERLGNLLNNRVLDIMDALEQLEMTEHEMD